MGVNKIQELKFRDESIEINQKQNCVLCDRELDDSWFNIVPDDGGEKYICPECLWKALLGGHMYIKNIEKGRELYGEE